jgi:membrane-bound lytic murein transglycosylase A
VPPATSLGSRKPWYSRRSTPARRQVLAGREIAWLADPIDARCRCTSRARAGWTTDRNGASTDARGVWRHQRPAFQELQWLADQGQGNMTAPWTSPPGPPKQRVQQLLWSNPRYVFFREEALSDFDAAFGPKGAQGVR